MNQTMLDAFADELNLILEKVGFTASSFSTPIEGPKRHPERSHMPPFKKSPAIIKRAFQKSQFSGPLSMGRFKMTSYIPPYRRMPIPKKKFMGAPTSY